MIAIPNNPQSPNPTQATEPRPSVDPARLKRDARLLIPALQEIGVQLSTLKNVNITRWVAKKGSVQ